MKLRLIWYKFLLKLIECRRLWIFIGSIIFIFLWPAFVVILTCGLLTCPFIALFKPEYFKKESKPKLEYKRYMVFSWCNYESDGGLDDCKNSFDKKEDAIEYASSEEDFSGDCVIFDRITGVKIK